ncbi:chaplin family protein [Streptomyces sp. URMC 123]
MRRIAAVILGTAAFLGMLTVPASACGNTVSVVGVLNPTHGNYCVNT